MRVPKGAAMLKQLGSGVLLATLCHCATAPTPPGVPESDRINAYIKGLDLLPADEPSVNEGDPSAAQAEGDYSCITTDFAETRRFDEIVAFAANSDSLFPGAILRGDSVYSGLFTQTVFDRQPATFSISLSNIAGAKSAEMQNPSLSEFRNEVGEILNTELIGATPANVFSEIEEVHSEEQLQLALGADFSWGGLPVTISADFSFNNQSVLSHHVVKFVQSFYTIDLDPPAQPSDFFASSVTADELAAEFNDGNPPVYVSSITFGRMVLFTFESQFSEQELNAALEFAYNGGGNVSGSTSLTFDEILSQTKITAYILGGSGGSAVQAINGFNELMAFIQEGGEYSLDNPGAPIAYKLNHLSDNSPARISLVSDYQVTECERVNQQVLVTVDSITVNSVSDEVGSGGDLELFGSVNVTGANQLTLFNRSRQQQLSIDEGQTFSVPGGNLGQGILDVVPQPGNEIRFDLSFTDADTFGDDQYQSVSLSAPFELGWRRSIPILVQEGGDAFIVNVSLQPI
jgi:thiol-activated cytolysin